MTAYFPSNVITFCSFIVIGLQERVHELVVPSGDVSAALLWPGMLQHAHLQGGQEGQQVTAVISIQLLDHRVFHHAMYLKIM